jgi:septal ring factor EnvC (AmiA/AmiB activator)
MFTYYDYFQRARAGRIQALGANLAQLAAVEQSIRDENGRLEALRGEYRRQAAALGAGQAERKRVLAALDREIASKGSELERMRGNEQRLGRLLESLREAMARIPPKPPAPTRTPALPFHRSKGKLPWPVAGRVAHRYGTSRQVGDLTWQGIVIRAPEGREVRAVARGRVAFADWLRGYGMLVILDHGKDYLSLYGYNQALYAEAGDWVEAGERIAGVGASGGQRASGLYFEIRRKSRPVNPLGWLAKDHKVARP